MRRAGRHQLVNRLRMRIADTPLRVQLAVIICALVAVALFATSFAGIAALRSYLLARVDNQLTESSHAEFARAGIASTNSRTGSTSTTTEGTFGAGPFFRPDGDELAPPGGRNAPALVTGYFTEVVDSAGNGQGRLQLPSGAHQAAPILPVLNFGKATSLSGKPFTANANGVGSDWRVLVTTFPDGSGAFVVATSLSDINKTVAQLTAINIAASTIVLVLLGVAGYAIVRLRLRRLTEVEKTAARIAEGDLTQRVPDAGGRSEVGHLASAINVMLTQVEAAFESQRASEAEARSSEQRMRRFVADASHELRTPLTSIRGFAELHRQGAAIIPTDRVIEKIESESTRMSVLVDDLLLLARLDQQRPLEHQPVDVVALVKDTVENTAVAASDHHFEFDVAPQLGQGLTVEGDPLRLRQVVNNLLANACTHTPTGSRIRVHVDGDTDEATITVADDGPGIPPDNLARIFERFYRVDPSRTRASGGTGLGLSIVAGIVQAHGGSVSVESQAGTGSTFTVRLPLAAALPDNAALPDDLALPDDDGLPDDPALHT